MGLDNIQGLNPNIRAAANTAKNKAKDTATFAYGGWSQEFGNIASKDIAKQIGIQQNGTKFSDIFHKETWQKASENISKFKNIKDTSLYQKPLETLKNTYSTANTVVAQKALEETAKKQAEKLAKEAAKVTATPGMLSRSIGWISKQMAPVIEKMAPVLKPIEKVLAPITNSFSKLGKVTKFPVLGTLLMTIGEIPKVYEASSKGGFGEGCKQIVRSTGELAVSCSAFAAGTAAGTATAGLIGQALCPIPGLGFVLGAVAGMTCAYFAEKVTKPVIDTVLGKSFAEKQEQAEKPKNVDNSQLANNPTALNTTNPTNKYASIPLDLSYLGANFGQASANVNGMSSLQNILSASDLAYLNSGRLQPQAQNIGSIYN
jgi:hypothetical protein